MADVTYSRRALASLTNHFDHLEDRNPTAARDFLFEIERTSDLIGEFPRLGRAVEGLTLRCHVTKRFRYRIIYLATPERVEIREILHPNQDWNL